MEKKTLIEPDKAKNEKINRRKFLRLSALTGISFMLPSYLSNTADARAKDTGAAAQDALIVYYSRTGNTQSVAEIIQQKVGGYLFEVTTAEPYTVVYDELVAQVDEQNETGYTPPLKCNVENIQAYDTLFFGFPTWDMQLPPPMKSFLDEYDLSGKTVVPFNTNGGYGLGSSIQQIEERCPEANIPEAFSTRGGLETDGIYLAIRGERRKEVHAEVVDWLKRIQML